MPRSLHSCVFLCAVCVLHGSSIARDFCGEQKSLRRLCFTHSLAFGAACCIGMSAEQMVAVWSEFGLGASHMKVSGADVVFTLCQGDMCERKSMRAPAAATGAPDMRLLGRLYLQPLALLAVGGIALLTFCIYAESAATDQILALVGGRQIANWILGAALLAHMFEGCLAFYICLQKLKLGLVASAAWCAHVMIVGFPFLQWVLKLQKHASSRTK